MTDKEIAELRRRLNKNKHNISTLVGRYINQKKETIHEFTTPFFMLSEEESEKYLSIFRRTMSGVNGKNLINAEFSVSQVEKSPEHELLTKLRKSALKDEETVKLFLDRVCEGVNFDTNVLILVMCDTYDVPQKHSDDSDSGDSTSIFSYIMCAVCPVKEAPATLGYDATTKSFRTRSCEWNVSFAELGFTFPAFDLRQTNIYNALYYVRNADESYKEFADKIFGTDLPLPAGEQKAIFEGVLANTLGDECSYTVVKSIHDDISRRIEEHKALCEPEQLTITRTELASVLSECGVADEKIEKFKIRCDEEYGSCAPILPRNIVEPKHFEVKTPDVTIKVNPERSDLVETRIINGRKYILISAEGEVVVNGVYVDILEND